MESVPCWSICYRNPNTPDFQQPESWRAFYQNPEGPATSNMDVWGESGGATDA
jgi:hypothetical protein